MLLERESTRSVQYYCNILPLSYLIDQRRLIFWQNTHCSDNVVLITLSALKDNTFVAIGSKYDICSYNVSVKSAVWNVIGVCVEVTVFFEYAILVYFCCFLKLYFTVYTVCCLPYGVINDDDIDRSVAADHANLLKTSDR